MIPHSTPQDKKPPPEHDDSCGLDLGTEYQATCAACIEERRRAFAMLTAGKSVEQIARHFRAPLEDVAEWLSKPQGIVPINHTALVRAALNRSQGRNVANPERTLTRAEVENVVRDILVVELPDAVRFLMEQGAR